MTGKTLALRIAAVAFSVLTVVGVTAAPASAWGYRTSCADGGTGCWR
jgi:hypothetical protein